MHTLIGILVSNVYVYSTHWCWSMEHELIMGAALIRFADRAIACSCGTDNIISSTLQQTAQCSIMFCISLSLPSSEYLL